jgi:hypothetical protein
MAGDYDRGFDDGFNQGYKEGFETEMSAHTRQRNDAVNGFNTMEENYAWVIKKFFLAVLGKERWADEKHRREFFNSYCPGIEDKIDLDYLFALTEEEDE